MCGIKKLTTLDKYLKELVQLGLLEKHERKTDDGGNMSNFYQLLLYSNCLEGATFKGARGSAVKGGSKVPSKNEPSHYSQARKKESKSLKGTSLVINNKKNMAFGNRYNEDSHWEEENTIDADSGEIIENKSKIKAEKKYPNARKVMKLFPTFIHPWTLNKQFLAYAEEMHKTHAPDKIVKILQFWKDHKDDSLCPYMGNPMKFMTNYDGITKFKKIRGL